MSKEPKHHKIFEMLEKEILELRKENEKLKTEPQYKILSEVLMQSTFYQEKAIKLESEILELKQENEKLKYEVKKWKDSYNGMEGINRINSASVRELQVMLKKCNPFKSITYNIDNILLSKYECQFCKSENTKKHLLNCEFLKMTGETK